MTDSPAISSSLQTSPLWFILSSLRDNPRKGAVWTAIAFFVGLALIRALWRTLR